MFCSMLVCKLFSHVEPSSPSSELLVVCSVNGPEDRKSSMQNPVSEGKGRQ